MEPPVLEMTAGKTESSAASIQAVRLLKLPAELRVTIYEMVLVYQSPLKLQGESSPKGATYILTLNRPVPQSHNFSHQSN